MIGISVLINGTPESSLASSTMSGHNEKTAVCELGSRPSPDMNLPAPRSWTAQPPEL